MPPVGFEPTISLALLTSPHYHHLLSLYLHLHIIITFYRSTYISILSPPFIALLTSPHYHHLLSLYLHLHIITTFYRSTYISTLSPPFIALLTSPHYHHLLSLYLHLHIIITFYRSTYISTLSSPFPPNPSDKYAQVSNSRHERTSHWGSLSTSWRNVPPLPSPAGVHEGLPSFSGERWTSCGAKSGLQGGCGKTVRSIFSIASMAAREVWGPVLSSCSKMFFLCFQTLLILECCSVELFRWWFSRAQRNSCDNSICVPKSCSHEFSCPSLNFVARRCTVLTSAHSSQWKLKFGSQFELVRLRQSKVALWNKRHFEKKKRRVCSMFKILSTYICWKKNIKCNIWSVAVRPSYIWDARFLKVKGG